MQCGKHVAIFGMASSVPNNPDVVDVISSHCKKLCDDAIEYLHHKHFEKRHKQKHYLDARMKEGMQEYKL